MTTTTGEDPKVLANYRFARGAVIILSILIVIALVALLLGFTRGGARPAAVPSSGGVQGRLSLRTRAYAGEEVDIIDTQDGHVIGRINVPLESGEKPPK